MRTHRNDDEAFAIETVDGQREVATAPTYEYAVGAATLLADEEHEVLWITDTATGRPVLSARGGLLVFRPTVILSDRDLALKLREAEMIGDEDTTVATLNEIAERLDLPADDTELGLTKLASERIDAWLETVAV